MGINFGTVATVWINTPAIGLSGHFQCIRYFECDEFGIPKTFPTVNERTTRQMTEAFLVIPGNPIAYWVSDRVRKVFGTVQPLSSFAKPRQGLATSDNQRFLRRWYEVGLIRVGFSYADRSSAKESGRKWFPCQKGGSVRKWYGNHEYVVNWHNDGQEMIALAAELYGSATRTIKNMSFYFREGITWSTITSASFSMRYCPRGFISETKGAVCFADDHTNLLQLLGFTNTNLASYLLKVTCPTLDFHEGPIGRLPFAAPQHSPLLEIVGSTIGLARADWDNFETSWDFRDLPLLRKGTKSETLAASWESWRDQCVAAIRRMQELETENNRIFIDAYGLADELKPEVPEEQITLAHADQRKDMTSYLSYALGCMMGRYSLDKSGLILANAGDSLAEYLANVGQTLNTLTFTPDEDGIIPVLDGEWFEDDIVARTHAFLGATFGEATLEANLRFIEESLGKNLRKYFLTDFYKDHLQTYKKRPIYWLFSSGKQRACQCLVYLHRYHEGTLARMRTEYVIPLQGKMAARIEQLASDIQKTSSTSQRKKLDKERDTFLKQQTELRGFDEKLRHYADLRITLDLDDGVKVNYGKFGDLLAEVKAVTGGMDED